MYEGGMTNVRTFGGVISDFYVSMSIYQGSALSYFLFTLVVDEFTKGIQDELLCACYLHMILFLLMRLEKELMISWSDRDIHQSVKVSD